MSLFVMKFLTTAQISPARLASFMDATQALCRGAPLSGEFAFEGDESVHEVEDYSKFSAADLPAWSGYLTLAFGNGPSLSGRADLLRVGRKKKSPANMGETAGYRSHEFEIQIADDESTLPANYRVLFEYFAAISSLLDVNFALGHQGYGFAAALRSSRGIEAGIPGIYQFTAFGSPFVDLIGADRLARLPAACVKADTGSGVIAMKVTDEFRAMAGIDIEKKCDELAAQIGEKYFSNAYDAPLGLPSGQVGLFSFVRALVTSKREADSRSRMAEIRPQIDWSGVFDS